MYQVFTRRTAHIVPVLCSAAAAYLLLANNRLIGGGIRDGMSLCVEVIIPSLFPFLVFTSFLAQSGWGQRFSRMVSPVVRYLFRLPEESGAAVFMSFIGGYPVGARMIARMMKENKLSHEDGERMLSFCVNAGPSFVLSAVGVRLFENGAVGILLLAAHLLSSMTVGFLRGLGHPVPPKGKANQNTEAVSPAGALIHAVSDSASGMLTLCAFIVLFSGILALLNALQAHLGIWGGMLCGLLEVTQGCVIASELPGVKGEILAAFLLSFGGLSVICQAAAGFSAYGETLSFGKFLGWRLVGGGVCTGWYLVLRLCFRSLLYRAEAVFGWLPSAARPVPAAGSATFPMTVCLLAVCAIAALTLEDEIP